MLYASKNGQRAGLSCLQVSLVKRIPLVGVLVLAVLATLSFVSLSSGPRAKDAKRVLVLGSGGTVGTALVAELRRQGVEVVEVKNRFDVDLRLEGAGKELQQLLSRQRVDFAFVAAGDRPKGLGLGAAPEETLWAYNLLIHENAFKFLNRWRVRFIFLSSHEALQPQASFLGRTKAAGEQQVAPLRYGRAVRLHTVYGTERVSHTSSFVTRWMYECMKYGAVDTGVLEEDEWQLAHAGDVARALVEAMRQWHLLPRRSAREVSTGTWVSARQLAAAINATARSPCAFHFTYNSVADTPGAVTALGSSAIGYALSSGAGPPEPSPPPPPPPAPPRSPSAEGYRGLVVSSNLTARLQELARSSAAILEEEASWRQREPYLSIILATSNDEYSRGADGGGVRSRTQNLIASIVETADAAHLDYEFVVVQYGPYVTEDYTDRAAYQTNATDVDLPFTQLFPWRHRRGFGRMRVITIPRGVFSWPNGEKQTGTAWPEFVAKNAGALRSRGKYLLFTNADDVYPHGIFAKIAQQQLEPSGVVYRAGIFLETVLSPKQSMAKQCDAIAAAADLCYFKNMACPDSQPRRNDSNHYYIGDFSIWSRADFFRTGGYLEYPQNTHLETGHWDYARDTFGLVNKWFDQFTCHQSHHRNPYAPTLVRWDTIAEMHANRTRGTSVGLTGVELPAAAMHDVLAAGYNPLEPFTSRAHDPVYGAWAEHLQSADLDPAFLHDFLGVRTNYEYDCRNMSGTRFTHLGRRIACDRHDEFVRRRRWIVGPVLGDLPVLDEEYYAWLVLLRAAKAAAARAPAGGPSDDPFVVIELGADYGAWLVRAAVALRRLQPARRVRLLGVEGSSAAFERLQEHVSSNGLAGPNSRLLRGWAGAKPQGKSGGGAGAVHSIPELLAEYNAVDFLHVDVGGAEEEALLEPATLESLTQRVRNIHVRTHSANSHAALARSFKARGWRILHDLPGGHGAQPARLPWSTPFGPMLLRGPGLLSLEADATSRRGLR